MASVKRKDINLLEQIKTKASDKESKGISMTTLFVLIVVFIFACILVFYYIAKTNRDEAKEKYDKLLSQVEDEKFVADYELSESLLEKLVSQREVNSAVTATNDELEAFNQQMQRVPAELITAINSAKSSDVTYKGISLSGGAVNISAIGKSALDASALVTALKETDLFMSVTYTGFSGEDDSYSFNVLAVLKL